MIRIVEESFDVGGLGVFGLLEGKFFVLVSVGE